MNRRDRLTELLPAIGVLGILFAMIAGGFLLDRPPSADECVSRWNRPDNRESQAEVAEEGFPRAYVAGWPTKAGDHCSATFFDRPGRNWVTFVLWLDAPDPTPRFGRNAEGLRYGRGELGAEEPIPANAEVGEDGTLSES